MKVYDCFMFFDELDLLEARLNILDSKVDYFVISESMFTHSGLPKELVFEKNRERFDKWKNKIIYITSTKLTDKLDFWKNENFQRNQLMKGIKKANPYDIIVLSDLDEIPNPDIFDKMKMTYLKGQELIGLEQIQYYYYMNLEQKDSVWNGTVMCKYAYVSENDLQMQDLRDRRFDCDKYVQNGGWHFSYLGGKDQIMKKLQSFAHLEYCDLEEWKVKFAIENNVDLFGRKDVKFKKGDADKLPEYVKNNIEKYARFWDE